MNKKNTLSLEQGALEKMAMHWTRWIGSPVSLVVHTIIFLGCIALGFFGVSWDEILLVLTTVVSLEAIYLAIFIQMTVNRNTESLEEVEKDIDEIQEDVDEIQEDVDEIQEDVDEIQEEEKKEEKKELETEMTLKQIQQGLQQLVSDIERIKKSTHQE